jgi:hypothetical protein
MILNLFAAPKQAPRANALQLVNYHPFFSKSIFKYL